MEQLQTSPFKFEHFYIVESKIKRNIKIESKDLNLKYRITPSGEIDSNNKKYLIKLIVDIRNDNDSFTAEVAIVGVFEFKDVVNKDNLSNYFYVNAPAIIYPYVRAYIASLTASSISCLVAAIVFLFFKLYIICQ